ncbi:MAG TPA: universal stress protein, partial [Longimicrobiaceae bacterium]|nr:universal stress protein [Longimicrobiaceae bacterium]
MNAAFRSILVAADLTPASAEVIGAAASLAQRTGAQLHVVHACDLPVLLYGNAASGGIAVQQRMQQYLENLKEQIRRVVPASVPVASQEVHFGAAATVILERANRLAADLIVLGPHRRRPVGDMFLGSTADKVIRSSQVPCLIVRGELPLPLRQVMVPVDLSDPARGALDLALIWAMRLGAVAEGERVPAVEVTVAHVIPRIFGTDSMPFDREVVAPELDLEIQGAVVRTGAGAHVGICEKIVWG